ncbi:hypothetical protein [Spirillospora sp. CA-294931]|uniref:hypothetical protein n=1 Tax=Spirillospora sp. CA-294931 TaxID=3240042 RepID=UPI003D8CD99E
MAMTPSQIRAELEQITDRIQAAWVETVNRQATLEEVEARLLALISHLDDVESPTELEPIGVFTSRTAATHAYRALASKAGPGASVRHRWHPEWVGTVATDRGRSFRIDGAARSRRYVLWVFVAWEHTSPTWTRAEELTITHNQGVDE